MCMLGDTLKLVATNGIQFIVEADPRWVEAESILDSFERQKVNEVEMLESLCSLRDGACPQIDRILALELHRHPDPTVRELVCRLFTAVGPARETVLPDVQPHPLSGCLMDRDLSVCASAIQLCSALRLTSSLRSAMFPYRRCTHSMDVKGLRRDFKLMDQWINALRDLAESDPLALDTLADLLVYGHVEDVYGVRIAWVRVRACEALDSLKRQCLMNKPKVFVALLNASRDHETTIYIPRLGKTLSMFRIAGPLLRELQAEMAMGVAKTGQVTESCEQ
jgi:hypothetical protein